MRKKSMRLVSAALAACMMTSVLPVSAFALDVGAAPESSVSTQAAAVQLVGGETIDDDFVTLHGSSYSMSNAYTENEEYTQNITIDTTKDVTINIDGDVKYVNSTNQEMYLFLVKQVGKLAVNAGKHKIAVTATAVRMVGVMRINAATHVVLQGGCYTGGNWEVFGIHGGSKVELNDVEATGASNAVWATINCGTRVEITGGKFVGTGSKPVLMLSGGDTLIKDAEVSSEGNAAVWAKYNTATVEIIGGKYSSSSDKEGAIGSNDGTITVKDAEITGKIGVDSRSANSKITISGCTIANSEKGIWVKDGTVILDSATFENNEHDIYLEADKTITIDKDYTGTATVGCADAATATDREIVAGGYTGDEKYKLVSADDGSVIGVIEKDGQKTLGLVERADGKFVIAAENATAKADLDNSGQLKELSCYTQVPAGTDVTLTADAAPDGWVFAGWQVAKPLSGLDLPADQTITVTVQDSDIVVSAQYEYVGTDIGDGGTGGAIAAVAVGVAAAWGVYEAGTGIYRTVNMKGIPMPANRGELALLVWQYAGQPEPANAPAFADIDDAELAKAAQWAVEQGLMDEKANNTFKPNTHVTKLRTCVTWDKAKQKSLFEKTEE